MERTISLEARRRPPGEKMTYAEFLARIDEDTYAEWVDGDVIMVSPVSSRHQDVSDFLTAVLRTYAQMCALGRVISAPFQMKLAKSSREPDILFVSKEHLERLRPTYLDGPADLVVEIISPESAARDRGEKFYEYEAAGIPEYWLIDPDRETAEFYRLEGDYYRTTFVGREGVYRSQVLPDFWLRVEWLWQDPLPPVEDVMLDIAGERYAQYLLTQLRKRGYI